jgi:hypothetical protein
MKLNSLIDVERETIRYKNFLIQFLIVLVKVYRFRLGTIKKGFKHSKVYEFKCLLTVLFKYLQNMFQIDLVISD